MPLAEIRVTGFRAFKDSGIVRIGSVTPFVGRNDAGKSGLLNAIRIFYNPPKRSGLDISDIHAKNPNGIAEIELAFDPKKLSSQEIKIDAKNNIHLIRDHLVDGKGLLRLRIAISTKAIERFEIYIQDVEHHDMFPLVMKNHDELMELLKECNLPATKAGKETNQEKRNNIREAAEENGVGFKEDWVDATSIATKLRDLLPNFIFFTDTANYGIGETPVQNQFKGIVDKALKAHPNAQEIENEIRTTIQTEFDKVLERLSLLTDSVTSLEAKARVNWKKAVDGIALSWGDPAGVSIPFEMRGAGVRRLFMVAYFQYEVATSIHEENGEKYIFAVEEPEVHLHPGAQRDLDIALRDLAELGHSVLFTTHSPVFASTAPIRDIALVTRPGARATVKQSPEINSEEVASELGIEASDRLIGKNYVILVEGPLDVAFYETVLTMLYDAEQTSLDPRTVLFLQCGGVGNLKFNVTTRCMDSAGLKWAVLADSDRATAEGEMGVASIALEEECPNTCSTLIFLKRTNIENYLDAAVVTRVTGLNCTINKYGKPVDSNGTALSKGLVKKIKKSGAIVMREMGLDGLLENSEDDEGICEFVTIFDEIHRGFDM